MILFVSGETGGQSLFSAESVPLIVVFIRVRYFRSFSQLPLFFFRAAGVQLI
jgi:hypothetical protein